MADIPSCEEFKRLTGRTGISVWFKKKQDLEPIYDGLLGMDPLRQSFTAPALPLLRGVRKACIDWLNANPMSPRKGKRRASWAKVKDLLERSNNRYILIAETVYHNTMGTANQGDAEKGLPSRPVNPRAPFIGKQLRGNLAMEHALPEHWGPHVVKTIETRYKNANTKLSMRAWATHICKPAMEDDPGGMYLGNAMNLDVIKGFQGVKYCTPEERSSYLIDVENGVLYDQDFQMLDTCSNETEFSGFGWAIFVLGFDNQLYIGSHEKNRFHHSSFFAGGAVQCGGEICCDTGLIRYLTAKTGHYQSSTWDFYRMLHFLSYHGVNLNSLLACPTPHSDKNFYNAQEVFENSGKSSGLTAVQGYPPRLSNPGQPSGWIARF